VVPRILNCRCDTRSHYASELADCGAFIDAYNDRCQPFAWTKDADQLIAKIRPSKN
jgi:hypothetical protein